MENLTAQQTLDLAKRLKTIAKAISDYKIQHWNNLSHDQFEVLTTAEMDILSAIQKLTVQAVLITAEEASVFMNQISDITNRIDHSLDQIANINKAIEIASGVTILAGAIASKNPQAIAAAVQGLAGILSE